MNKKTVGRSRRGAWRRAVVIAASIAMWPVAQAQTLDECQQAAERNYPLIRQYDLIALTTDLNVSNIQKGWLPQLSATAQATLQSDVTAWPQEMQTMLGQMDVHVKGLAKDQYRVGVDVSQTLYDGGRIRTQKAIARQQGEVEAAQTEATLYQVRQRVNEMYFSLLLLDDQLRLNDDLQQLLATNEQKLASMFRNGTAAESDYLAVKAERLAAAQQHASLESNRRTLQRVLTAFCGIEVAKPEKPAMPAAGAPGISGIPGLSGFSGNSGVSGVSGESGLSGPSGPSHRPELKAIDAQLRLADAQEEALNTALMPRLSVFAQGFYGYPGLNMFEDMMHRQWSLNGLIGARLTWNIGALYTRKADRAKLQTQRDRLATQRDVFLFNNRLSELQQTDDISRYRQLMADDEEIIALRQKVRRAAESKLAHGIIDAATLVKEINNENQARVQQSTHEIEMLREAYNLIFTLNP